MLTGVTGASVQLPSVSSIWRALKFLAFFQHDGKINAIISLKKKSIKAQLDKPSVCYHILPSNKINFFHLFLRFNFFKITFHLKILFIKNTITGIGKLL